MLYSKLWPTNAELYNILYVITTLASVLRCLSTGHSSCSVILETDEYLKKSFTTNFTALL